MEDDNDLKITPCAVLHYCFAGNSNYKKQIPIEIPIKEKIPIRGLGIVLPKNTITSFATQKLIEIIINNNPPQ